MSYGQGRLIIIIRTRIFPRARLLNFYICVSARCSGFCPNSDGCCFVFNIIFLAVFSLPATILIDVWILTGVCRRGKYRKRRTICNSENERKNQRECQYVTFRVKYAKSRLYRVARLPLSYCRSLSWLVKFEVMCVFAMIILACVMQL